MKKKGFTLIELLAVIVILGILLTLSIIAVNNIREKQEEENEKNVISSILTGAKLYCAENTCTDSVSVSTIKDAGFVEYDENKFRSFDGLSVDIEPCGVQRMFEIDTDGDGDYDYNDCGCKKQDGEVESEKLCVNND